MAQPQSSAPDPQTGSKAKVVDIATGKELYPRPRQSEDLYPPVAPLLKELVLARGPCGVENEVRVLCVRELTRDCDEVFVDKAGNVVGKIFGTKAHGDDGAVRLLAHMDELSLVVKKVESDGSLVIRPLGGCFPAKFGEGLVEVLGDTNPIEAVLSYGSEHISKDSGAAAYEIATGGTVTWEDTRVVTRIDKMQLEQNGVRAGTRIVVAPHRRVVSEVNDCLAGYFLDNRAPLAAMIGIAEALAEERPLSDTYFVATVMEEVNASGASFAAANLPGAATIALDVAPVAQEYDVDLNPNPVIIYGDGSSMYSKELSDMLFVAAREAGFNPQSALLERYWSDASQAQLHGGAGASALMGIPTYNTHGFEMIHRNGIAAMQQTFARFLRVYDYGAISAQRMSSSSFPPSLRNIKE